MKKYIGKKILWAIITIVAVAAVVFTLFYLAPDDPANVKLDKPVIYLYPEKETEVTVSLDLAGKLAVSYPAYNGGWRIAARPDGTLTNLADGREYSYLFWEAADSAEYDFSRGFCVRGEDTAEFLQETLAEIGLTTREYNEFIVYWLPKMQSNAYNVIAFQYDNYTDRAKLAVSPEPDSVLRVFMAWYGSDEAVDITPQTFGPFAREGFTLVEWGGCEVK